MKKVKLILFLLLLGNLKFGQNIKVKEKFDYLADKEAPIILGLTYLNDEANYADGFCKILEGYLNMYELTKDKAYLYRFISESLKIMSTRHDVVTDLDNDPRGLPRWTFKYESDVPGYLNNLSNYMDGYIVAAFSRFGYIVNQDPVIAQTSLHPFNEMLPGIQFNYTGITFTTFGHYANWLEDRVHETINYFLYDGYWSDSEGYLWGLDPDDNKFVTQKVNQQVGFARALLFNGLSTGNVDFMNRANIIANRMIGNIQIGGYNGPWLFDQVNNSYSWYYYGWSIEPNVYYFDYFRHDIEDMSHGVLDIQLFFDFWKYQPNQNITNSFMVKFHNTFTNNLYDGNGQFFGSVNGTDNIQDGSYGGNVQMYNHNRFSYSSLGYSNLSEFEFLSGSNPNSLDGKNVFQICEDFYINKINNLSLFSEINHLINPYAAGAIIQGVSYFANQQWQRECVDLSLFKRKLVYDQDFAAQGVLTIEPRADLPLFNSPTSFALPYITTNEFTIEAGVTSTIEGGFGVKIKDGFTAKMGSKVTIKPAALPCVKSMGSYVVENDQPSEPTQQNDSDADGIINENELTIYPNPASNTFTITTSNFVNSFTLEIVDIQGKKMHTQSITSANEVINISNLSSGIYFCKITNGDEVRTQKLIIE